MEAVKKRSKSKIALIIILIVVLLLATTGLVLWLTIFKKGPPIGGSFSPLNVYVENDYYLGTNAFNEDGAKENTYSLSGLIGEYTSFKINGSTDVATLSGENITINKAGSFKLDCSQSGKKDTKEVTVVEGFNVTTQAQMKTIIEKGLPVVLHKSLDLTPEKTNSYTVKASVYGNGVVLNATAYNLNDFDTVFNVVGKDVILRDLHMIGRKVEAESKATLTSLVKGGIMIEVNGNEEIGVPSASIINCILENGNRLLVLNDCSVSLKGTIIRNAADSCISIQTNTEGPTKLVTENCVLANAVVAGITNWCMDVVKDAAFFADIEIKGFLDIYNWKNIKNVQIMPDAEPLSGVVTPIIKEYIKSKEYDKYMYNFEEQKYLHAGIIIISSNKETENKPTVSGLEAQKFARRNFPFPDIAYKFIRTCDVIGYEQDVTIKPNQELSQNKNLYKELRNGR